MNNTTNILVSDRYYDYEPEPKKFRTSIVLSKHK